MAPNSADDHAIEARRLKAWDLRVQGKSYRQIAEETGVSGFTAFHDVKAMLDKARQETNDTVEHHRSIQLARLDKAIAVLMPMLDNPETALQAMDRLDKLERRRAELLGLDAPEKHAVLTAESGDVTPAKAREIMSSLFGSVTPGVVDSDV